MVLSDFFETPPDDGNISITIISIMPTTNKNLFSKFWFQSDCCGVGNTVDVPGNEGGRRSTGKRPWARRHRRIRPCTYRNRCPPLELLRLRRTWCLGRVSLEIIRFEQMRKTNAKRFGRRRESYSFFSLCQLIVCVFTSDE